MPFEPHVVGSSSVAAGPLLSTGSALQSPAAVLVVTVRGKMLGSGEIHDAARYAPGLRDCKTTPPLVG